MHWFRFAGCRNSVPPAEKVCAVDPRHFPFAGHLRVTNAFLHPAIEIGAELVADLLCSLDETMRQRKDRPIVFNFQRAAVTSDLRIAALLVVLRLPEEGQNIVKAPPTATHLRPPIEVGRVAANIEHAVDGT